MKHAQEHYFELIYLLEMFGIPVYDSKLHGPGVSIIFNKHLNGSISIEGGLSWYKKVYVLLHEMGHLLTFKDDELHLRKIPGTELEANDFACSFIELWDVGTVKAYEKLYNDYHGKNTYLYGKKKKLQSKRTRSSKKTKSRKSTVKKRS